MTYLRYVGEYAYLCDKVRYGDVWKELYVKSLGKILKEEGEIELDNWRNEHKKYIVSKIPRGKFDVVYADPPWKYEFSKSKSRAIESHYITMELVDICNLKIPIGDNAVLFLWATSPKLEQSFKVIKSWGFEYKTSMIWVKDKVGMGYYARGQHELLLIAVKGKMLIPAPAKRRDSVIFAPVVEHSKKPEIVYTIIESMYPNCKYLELFARNERENWISWGNEIE